ncbi:MAG: hypothetical protein J6X35_12105 [Bacteroidales bacterium]|nr:hypothetical protein [Bacteroidales bacterium]
MGNVRRKHGWFKMVHETMRRQLKQLFLCPFWTPSCPETDVFPRKTVQGCSKGNFDSRNIDIRYHIIYSADPPVG